jgi:hypothetical protein
MQRAIRLDSAGDHMLLRTISRRLLWVLAIGLAAAVPASAQSISEPEVEKGQTKIETFSVHQSGFNGGRGGDVREIHNPAYSRGLTDTWMIKAYLVLERPFAGHHRGTAGAIENTFELLNAKKSGGFGLAWWTGLAAALDDEETNAVSFGPIVRIGSGPTSLVLNPFIEKTFGRNREEGMAFVYGWQLKHEVRKSFWIGVEGFGKLPDIGGHSSGGDEHRAGPVLTYEFEVGDKRSLTVEGGVQFGVTDATPDRAVKLQVTYTY